MQIVITYDTSSFVRFCLVYCTTFIWKHHPHAGNPNHQNMTPHRLISYAAQNPILLTWQSFALCVERKTTRPLMISSRINVIILVPRLSVFSRLIKLMTFYQTCLSRPGLGSKLMGKCLQLCSPAFRPFLPSSAISKPRVLHE